jgi:hypothetical protein
MEKDLGRVREREKLVLVVLEIKERTYYWYHNWYQLVLLVPGTTPVPNQVPRQAPCFQQSTTDTAKTGAAWKGSRPERWAVVEAVALSSSTGGYLM